MRTSNLPARILMKHISGGEQRLIVDFSRLTFISSSGMRVTSWNCFRGTDVSRLGLLRRGVRMRYGRNSSWNRRRRGRRCRQHRTDF